MELYKVVVEKDDGTCVAFGFNKFSDAIEFFRDCAETADGFEEGKTKISIIKKEDK